jgi:hypothetical protein
MLKRFASGAAVALAASLGLSAAAHATTTVTFDDRNIATDSYQTEANSFTEQGLTFGGQQFYLVAAQNQFVTFPTGYNSVFMETALEPVSISLAGGGAFDFLSLDLGLGDYNQGLTDTVAVIGTKADCVVTPSDDCTVSTVLTVGNTFATYNTLTNPGLLLFTHLSQIAFGTQQLIGQDFPPAADGGYLAFDNISVAAFVTDGGAAVPEPSAWAMMIVGCGGVGALMRRKGRRAAVLTATA